MMPATNIPAPNNNAGRTATARARQRPAPATNAGSKPKANALPSAGKATMPTADQHQPNALGSKLKSSASVTTVNQTMNATFTACMTKHTTTANNAPSPAVRATAARFSFGRRLAPKRPNPCGETSNHTSAMAAAATIQCTSLKASLSEPKNPKLLVSNKSENATANNTPPPIHAAQAHRRLP